MKRLYIVSVSTEYAVMAESESDALDFISEAVKDDSTIADRADVCLAKDANYAPPDGWGDGALVYGTSDDLTLAQAIERDKADAAEVKP